MINLDFSNCNHRKKWREIIQILAISILLSSCLNQEVCEDVSTVPVRIGFYRSVVDGPSTAYSIDSLTIYGLGKDSIIYNNQKSVGRVELPLDTGRDSCGFVFVFPEINDTVWFYYQVKPNLVSMDCGFVSYYEITEIKTTDYLITAVEIVETSVTNSLDEHIKIFPLILAPLQ